MGACETKAWGTCDCCGKPVAVKCNRSGMAYYRCDHCGVQVQHHWAKSSSKFLQELGAEGAAPAAPAAVEEKRKEPEKVAAPAKVKKPAVGGPLGIFFGGE